MTFYPRNLLLFVAFIAAILLAVNARMGHIDPLFAILGIVAILTVEGMLFVGLWTGRKTTR